MICSRNTLAIGEKLSQLYRTWSRIFIVEIYDFHGRKRARQGGVGVGSINTFVENVYFVKLVEFYDHTVESVF